MCTGFASITLHDTEDCCIPYDIALGLSCDPKQLLRRIPIVGRYADKIPDFVNGALFGQHSGRYCSGDSNGWHGTGLYPGTLGLYGAITLGDSRRGAPIDGDKRFSMGASIELGGGYNFEQDHWFGELTGSASVSMDASLWGAKITINKDAECVWDLRTFGLSCEY